MGSEKTRPTDLELQVLSVLWEAGEATVHQIRRDLPDGKPRAYTTVLSVLQGMERRTVLGPVLRSLTANLFGGRPARVMQMLLDDAEISDGDRREIRKLLRELDDADTSKDGKGAER